MIYPPKEVGGLGAKWAWKIQKDEGGFWLQIFKNKYLPTGGREIRPSIKRSQFASAILKVRSLLRLGKYFEIHDGRITQFWWDMWCGNCPFYRKFPRLFACATKPDGMVAGMWDEDRWATGFRRALGPDEIKEWEGLKADIIPFRVFIGRDLDFRGVGTILYGLIV